MKTTTLDTKQNLRPTWGDPAPRTPVTFCPCCDETRVPDKYHVCTACQKYLADVDEMMASE